jgi:hypothetical protein
MVDTRKRLKFWMVGQSRGCAEAGCGRLNSGDNAAVTVALHLAERDKLNRAIEAMQGSGYAAGVPPDSGRGSFGSCTEKA